MRTAAPPAEVDAIFVRMAANLERLVQLAEAHATQPMAYKAEDVCRLLNISRGTFYELVRSGKLRTLPVADSVYRVARTELERFTREGAS